MPQAPKDAQADATGDAPLHVLHVADADHAARLGRMYRQLAIAIDAAGPRVTLLSDDPVFLREFEDTPIRTVPVRSFWGWDRWRLPHLLRRMLRDPPNVLHLWGTTALRTFSRISTEGDALLLVHTTSPRDAERVLRRPRAPHEHVLCATHHQASLLGEPVRADPSRLAVCPPALLPPERCEEFDPRQRTLGIIWVGRYAGRNGLDVLLKAVAQLRAARVDLQLGLIGRGPGADDVWHRIHQMQLQHCTTLGDAPSLWDHTLPGADICVVPACEQGVALAPLLAMAWGKIVIASRDQVADWFQEGETCLMYEPGSTDELVRLLRQARNAHPNVRALSRSAAAYVAANHSAPRIADMLVRTYRSLLGARRESARPSAEGQP